MFYNEQIASKNFQPKLLFTYRFFARLYIENLSKKKTRANSPNSVKGINEKEMPRDNDTFTAVTNTRTVSKVLAVCGEIISQLCYCNGVVCRNNSSINKVQSTPAKTSYSISHVFYSLCRHYCYCSESWCW